MNCKGHDHSGEPVTTTLPPPFNVVHELELKDVIEILHATTHHPNACFSKGQLKAVADKVLGKLGIAEQRLINIATVVLAMGKAASEMPADAPGKAELDAYFQLLITALNGRG